MPQRKKPRLEGTDDGEGHRWKLLSSTVYYGPGFHEKFYLKAADSKGVTKEAVLQRIQQHREEAATAAATEGSGNKPPRLSADAAMVAQAKMVVFATDSKRECKQVNRMNLDGPQRDYEAARQTTARNKKAAAEVREELTALRQEREQLWRLLEEFGVKGVPTCSSSSSSEEGVDLGSLAETLLRLPDGAVSESLLQKLLGVGLRVVEEELRGKAVGRLEDPPKLGMATVGLPMDKQEQQDAALEAAQMLLDDDEVDSDWAETSDDEEEMKEDEDGGNEDDVVVEDGMSALAAQCGFPNVPKKLWARIRIVELRVPKERQQHVNELHGAQLHIRRLQKEVRQLKKKVRARVSVTDSPTAYN